MPATEVEACEDDITQGSTLMWSRTFQGFLTRFKKLDLTIIPFYPLLDGGNC